MQGKRLQMSIVFSDSKDGLHVETTPYLEQDIQDMRPASYLTMIIIAEAINIVSHNYALASNLVQAHGDDAVHKEVAKFLPRIMAEGIDDDELTKVMNIEMVKYLDSLKDKTEGGNGS